MPEPQSRKQFLAPFVKPVFFIMSFFNALILLLKLPCSVLGILRLKCEDIKEDSACGIQSGWTAWACWLLRLYTGGISGSILVAKPFCNCCYTVGDPDSIPNFVLFPNFKTLNDFLFKVAAIYCRSIFIIQIIQSSIKSEHFRNVPQYCKLETFFKIYYSSLEWITIHINMNLVHKICPLQTSTSNPTHTTKVVNSSELSPYKNLQHHYSCQVSHQTERKNLIEPQHCVSMLVQEIRRYTASIHRSITEVSHHSEHSLQYLLYWQTIRVQYQIYEWDCWNEWKLEKKNAGTSAKGLTAR